MLSVEQIAAEILHRQGRVVAAFRDAGANRAAGGQGMAGASASGSRRQSAGGQALADLIELYYRQTHVDRLPECLQACVFDMYADVGDQAVRTLQRLLSDTGQPVAVDGKIGEETVDAACLACLQAARHVVDAYGIARRNVYYRMGDEDPARRADVCRENGAKGHLVLRAEQFVSQRYHLSDAEHRARVASWR